MSPVFPAPGTTACRSSWAAAFLVFVAMAASASAGESPAAAPQEATDAPPRRVDARTEEIVRRMSVLLATTRRFALEAEETTDDVSDNAPRLQLTNVRRVAVSRPDKLATDVTGDSLDRVAVYDGRTLSVLDKGRNSYFTHAAPPTIDAALDAVAEKLGVVLPLSDFAYADPYAVLMEKVLYGEYRGVHLAAGVPCHHLAFTQEDIEWQLWVDAGEEPLPRKLLIAYVDEPGVPQYTATIRRWSLKPAFTDDLFEFVAPEGATEVPVREFLPAAAPTSPGSDVPADAPKREEKP